MRIICMFKEIKEKKHKKQLKYVALGGVVGAIRWPLLFPVHRGGCTYVCFLVQTSFPCPPPAAILVCSNASWRRPVLLCASVSLTPPTWQHSNIKKLGGKKTKEKKTSYAVHGLRKSVKINTLKNKFNVLQFFSLPNTKWCFIFRLGILSYAKHI